DVIIFKDGFVLKGKVRRQIEWHIDPITGVGVPLAKVGGFYVVETDPRRIVFSPSQVQEVLPDTPGQIADLVQMGFKNHRLLKRQPMPKTWELVEETEFNNKWERSVKLFLPEQNPPGHIRMEQRLVWLTPEYARVDYLGYTCNAYYLTSELG